MNDGILGGWALVNQVNFANYDATNGVSVATYTSTDIATAGATDNVDYTLGAATTTIGDMTINALKWTSTDSAAVIEQGDGTTLTLDTGGLLTMGNFYKTIRPVSGGSATITANGGALYVHNSQSNIYINSIIADGDMPTALVKTQAGNLVLYSVGDNTYSGGTYIKMCIRDRPGAVHACEPRSWPPGLRCHDHCGHLLPDELRAKLIVSGAWKGRMKVIPPTLMRFHSAHNQP